MGCHRYQNQFSDYLENSLDRAQRDLLERHLRACPACRADLDSIRKVVETLHAPGLRLRTPDGNFVEAPPSLAVQRELAHKIRSVRQPMGWWEALRLQWQAGGLASRTRAWGMGLVITGILFAAGVATHDRWSANGTQLSPIPPVGPHPTTMDGGRAPVAPAPGIKPPVGGTRIFSWAPAVPAMAAGQQATIYLRIEADRDMADAEICLFPAANVSILGNVTQLNDASYLLRRGPIMAGRRDSLWVPVEICPTTEGMHALRVIVREGDRVVAQTDVPLQVGPQAP